jgi:hypothetical protein
MRCLVAIAGDSSGSGTMGSDGVQGRFLPGEGEALFSCSTVVF